MLILRSEIAVSILLGYIVEIGLDVVKDKIKDFSMETAARTRLTEYLEKQQKLNFNCTKEEEIDFEGLADYIRHNLIEDVRQRLFASSKAERDSAYKTIIAKARDYAQSRTKISEHRAVLMVSTAMDILRKYYMKKVNRELTFLANCIEDEIINTVSQQNMQLSQQIEQIHTEIVADNPFTPKHNLQLAGEGRFDEVGENISAYMELLNSKHPLKPYYGFNIARKGDKYELVSIPLCEEAGRKYPPRIHFSATPVRIGHKEISQLANCDIFKYAYRHQLPITLNVSTAEKLLGDTPDPNQTEAREMEKNPLVLVPPKFPKAFPCSISINDKVVFDYLLMRTKEILEDGTVVVTNEEQDNRSFDISFSISQQTHKMSFNIRALSPSNIEQLKYRNFIKDASKGGRVVIKSLSLGCWLGAGNLAPFAPAETLDDEIQFLKKLIEIERYFKVSFAVPKEILRSDHEIIDYIFSIIHMGSFSGHWTSFNIKFEVDDEFKKTVENLEDIAYLYQYTYAVDVELFEKKFSFGVKRELHSVKFENLQHIKRKVRESDIGDIITINYIPDSTKDNTFTDCFAEERNSQE